MNSSKNKPELQTRDSLTSTIQQTNQYFLQQAQKQVNTALTLRNWLIGYYISEYEL